MSQEIYNEGRVVGYSAWELYVKQSLTDDPESTPASEREWLSETIGNGKSIILKVIGKNTDETKTFNAGTLYYQNLKLPENTSLCAAQTIIGSVFIGKVIESSDGKILGVKEYGPGIANGPDDHTTILIDDKVYVDSSHMDPNPNSEIGSYLPVQTPGIHPEYLNERIELMNQNITDYSRILDGQVLQPGTYEETKNIDHDPYLDLIRPDFEDTPVVRLTFANPPINDFYILLTGFSNSTIIKGESGIEGGSTSTLHPENGDFLGPTIFPWANKIVFTTPPYLATMMLNKVIPVEGSDNIVVTPDPETGSIKIQTSKVVAGEHIKVSRKPGKDPKDYVITGSNVTSENNYLKVDETKDVPEFKLTASYPSAVNVTGDFLTRGSIEGPNDYGETYSINVNSKSITEGNGISILNGPGNIRISAGQEFFVVNKTWTLDSYNGFGSSATISTADYEPKQVTTRYDLIYHTNTKGIVDYAKYTIHFKVGDSMLYNRVLSGDGYPTYTKDREITFSHGSTSGPSYETSRICIIPKGNISGIIDPSKLRTWYGIGNNIWNFHGASRSVTPGGTSSDQWSFPVYPYAKYIRDDGIVIGISAVADSYGYNPTGFNEFVVTYSGHSYAGCKTNGDKLNLTMILEFY